MKILNTVKKYLSVLISICIVVSTVACSKEVANETEKITQREVVEVTETLTSLCEDEEMSNPVVVYDYEQELNVIEDNYRNYYEIFVYSFYDSDGDGIGDINGVIEKLDYIEDMGFNGIWLMPIMQSTTYHKYDVVDYYTIDKEYGSMDDFKKLIDECHKREIRVVIDFVINHTSSKNQWFIDACEYLRGLDEGEEPNIDECPYVDYYHFEREQKDGTFYKVNGSQWYYEGAFWSEMPDLNLGSELVREEIQNIAKAWIDMGVDGFRMDAAIHFEESNVEFNTECLNWLYEYCKEMNSEFYMVSEVWANKATITEYYKSCTPSMFNFDVADAEGKIIKAARGNYKAANFVDMLLKYQTDYGNAYSNYIDAPFITNHDMGRVANGLMKDEKDMKMAAGLLLTMNGSPFVYYGEEIGMSSAGKKDENKRLSMIWSEADSKGITEGPKDADAGIESAFDAVDKQIDNPLSILNYYKRAIRLRNENPEIARGKIDVIEELTVDYQAVITKEYEGQKIGIVYNTSDEEINIDMNGSELEDMDIRGYLTVNGEVIEYVEGVLKMPVQSICILK